MNGVARTRVLFVCLGNICRSPTAHAVFESLLARRGLSSVVEVDSCGTGEWHVGHPAHEARRAERSGFERSAEVGAAVPVQTQCVGDRAW